MSSPYIGEIRMFGGSFAIAGWAFCQGQSQAISENDTLFNLIGTTYGGDGQETFNLPDLSGRAPVHQGQGPGISQQYVIGQSGGVEQVTLSVQQMPSHTHAAICSTGPGNQTDPDGAVPGTDPSVFIYYEDIPDSNFKAGNIKPAGGSQPHENMQPFLVVNYLISLYGIYPSPT
jgi:microcystin-dependent protein